MSQYIDELNARALAATLSDLRSTTDDRLVFLENRVATLSILVTDMQRVMGEVLAAAMGRGSTVPDEG